MMIKFWLHIVLQPHALRASWLVCFFSLNRKSNDSTKKSPCISTPKEGWKYKGISPVGGWCHPCSEKQKSSVVSLDGRGAFPSLNAFYFPTSPPAGGFAGFLQKRTPHLEWIIALFNCEKDSTTGYYCCQERKMVHSPVDSSLFTKQG